MSADQPTVAAPRGRGAHLLARADTLIVVDLECICGPGLLPADRAIIDMGAVRVSTSDGAVCDTFDTLVRPPGPQAALTAETTALTGITPAMLHGAPTFGDAYDAWVAWLGDTAAMRFVDWGRFDAVHLDRMARAHGRRFVFGRRTTDIKRVLQATPGMPRGPLSLHGALARLGETPVLPAHRALSDALSTAKLVPYVLGWRAIPPRGPRRGRPERARAARGAAEGRTGIT